VRKWIYSSFLKINDGLFIKSVSELWRKSMRPCGWRCNQRAAVASNQRRPLCEAAAGDAGPALRRRGASILAAAGVISVASAAIHQATAAPAVALVIAIDRRWSCLA